ncbi:XRE family transcriptional regulator [Enterococcus faecalis]|uniref:MobT family relaxase n=1 Tax=Enterococcus faecalis TaxID=1351 RepID=UPI000CF1C565|nr:MobT family relaxase [Enterococcus faecalis]EJJ1465403.1 XRE family transcriptional regulator [Enterococcus faecalis]PQC45116.1 Cro/Cl family transcriptional regulator [Enterococcus faecalis]PQF97089.1 Cro/Cl family transcriptional regulator [Enterococcus faecalis]ROX67717.1 XRE family transcriptional regulator [Enterococcus faecalis]ROX95599.1 XRE family transcriptional regulator [Enterococcus faecalis]
MRRNFTKELLKEKRKEYKVTQNKLAIACDLSREYLNKIESGKKVPAKSVMRKIFQQLETFNPDLPLTLLFDYVRIRFPTTNARKIIQEVLHLNFDYMLHEDYAFYSYQEQYVMGDIVVMVSQEEDKGILIEMKGRGCRQFETFLLAQKRSWYDFFETSLKLGGVMKRLDLAINDRVGLLNIPYLTKKCQNEECISLFRTFKSYRSGELLKADEKDGMGNTLYIGSLKSEVYFCLYEKDYEQYIKLGIPLDQTETKNRFEIRLKNERAYHAIMDLMKGRSIESTTFSIITRYMRIADKVQGKRRTNWPLNEKWGRFVGRNRKEIQLTSEPKPYTIERTYNWLGRQVAPTLKMTIELDRIRGTSFISDMVLNAELSERHKKILEQQSMAIENLIV